MAAAQDHATSGAVYRLPLANPAAIEPVLFGESPWLGALVDRTGQLHWSQDAGRQWHRHAQRLPMISALLLMP